MNVAASQHYYLFRALMLFGKWLVIGQRWAKCWTAVNPPITYKSSPKLVISVWQFWEKDKGLLLVESIFVLSSIDVHNNSLYEFWNLSHYLIPHPFPKIYNLTSFMSRWCFMVCSWYFMSSFWASCNVSSRSNIFLLISATLFRAAFSSDFCFSHMSWISMMRDASELGSIEPFDKRWNNSSHIEWHCCNTIYFHLYQWHQGSYTYPRVFPGHSRVIK